MNVKGDAQCRNIIKNIKIAQEKNLKSSSVIKVDKNTTEYFQTKIEVRMDLITIGLSPYQFNLY